MNQKELNEIRRRFKLDKNSISRIYGCYVNSSREIIAYIDESMGLMSQEEQEMYLGLLKKALSGGLGRNLINIEFSTAQVAGSDEHRLLQAVRQSSAQDKDAREALYRRIIDAMDMGETNYLILLAADTYDVPYKGRDDETFSDGSDTVFQYFLCSICPVKAPTLELKYNNENSGFHSASTGHIALPPELGFLFPAFDDRAANIYNALFYSKNAAEIHQEVITVELDFRQQFQIMRGKGMIEIFTGRALGRKHQDRIFQKLFQRAGQMLEGKTVRITYEHIVEIF